MNVRVVVGPGQEALGRQLCDVLGPLCNTSLWSLHNAELREVGDGAGPVRRVRDLVVGDQRTMYVVLDDLPGRGAFIGSGTSFLHRVWIWEELRRGDCAVSPALLLAAGDIEWLVRRHASYAVLFAGAADVVRIPFRLAEFRSTVENLATRDVRSWQLRPYLHPGVAAAGAADAELRHRAGNLLGALALLEGAFAYGDLSVEDYAATVGRVWPRIISGVEPLVEYLAARGLVVDTAAQRAGRAPSRPRQRLHDLLVEAARRKRPDDLRVLLVDNEVHHGWADALAAILAPISVYAVGNLRASADGFEALSGHPDGAWEPTDLGTFDLILLDLRLDPRVDTEVDRAIERRGVHHARRLSGFRLLQSIRRSTRTRAVPVIVFTASEKWYAAETVREFRDVWFRSKEWSTRGPSGDDTDVTGRYREHYDSFRKAIAASISRPRQNTRRAWHAVQQVLEGSTVAPRRRELIHRHLLNAYEHFVEGVARDSGRGDARGAPFYATAILHANMAVEEYGLKPRLPRVLSQPLDRDTAYAVCVKTLRDAAAHAFAADQIGFLDVVIVFRLTFHLLGVEWEPVGMVETPHAERLVSHWILPSLGSVMGNLSDTAVSIGQQVHTILRSVGTFWRDGIAPEAAVPTAPLTRAELQALNDLGQVFVCVGAAPPPLQLLFRYMLVLLVLARYCAPLDTTVAAVAFERWTNRDIYRQLDKLVKSERGIALYRPFAGLPAVGRMPLGSMRAPR